MRHSIMRAFDRAVTPAAPNQDDAVQDNVVQMGQYANRWLRPTKTTADDHYVPALRPGAPGVVLDVASHAELLRRWQGDTYQELFRGLRGDETLNTGFPGAKYPREQALHNGWYPTPDAEIYAAMILDQEPDVVIEVGSGFSTHTARRAIDYSGRATRLEIIDPQPRTDVASAADRVDYTPAEASDLLSRELTPKSLLFIDSSHVTRARGDVPYLFCQLIPQLPPGVLVHVHDIFMPYDYPTNYDHLCWSEQYVLQALLTHSSRYETVFATHWMTREHGTLMQATFGPCVGENPLFYGASYWFRVREES